MFRKILVEQFSDIRRDEWPRALLLSAFFFLVIATYWIIKPIKRGVIINYFGDQPLTFLGFVFEGAESEQFGKVLNLVAVYFIVVLFTALARRVPRHWLVGIFAAIFAAAFALYAALISDLNEGIVWSFYVFGDMFNTAMVGLFWAFTNDITKPEEANRTYGIIGLGGVIGGFVGATVVSSSVEDVGRAKLLLLCVVPMVLIAIIGFVVHRLATRGDEAAARRPAASRGKRGASAAMEGASLVFKSKYLLAIAGLIGAYEVVSNIIDFQLAATVEAEADHLEIDAFFALVGQIIGIASIVVQLLLTSFVLRTFGIRIALMFLPAFILLGSTGFLILPTLFFAAAMSVSDNALNYSINQSAKEALYTPTSPDETYKAKAFIDMFVQRFAKVISVVLNLVMAAAFASGVRWLSLITLGVLALWFYLVIHAGKGFRERVAASRKERGVTTKAEAEATLSERTAET